MEDMVRFIQLLNLEFEGFSFTPGLIIHGMTVTAVTEGSHIVNFLERMRLKALDHPNGPDAIMKIAKKKNHPTCELDQWGYRLAPD